MDNRRVGFERSAVARFGRGVERPMEIARAINHAVIATEWLARLILLLAALLVLYYAADREPPFRLISTEPAEAQAGEYLTLRNKVHREVSRGCNTEFTRYIFDSHGTRYDMGHAQATAETIARMERKTPGELLMSLRLPPNLAPGPATLQTVLHHECNRVHNVWPIRTTVDMPFTVLP